MNNQLLRDLTWNHLYSWAGAKVLARGKRYKRNVLGISQIDDNHLHGVVRGGLAYKTEVWFADQKLRSQCTCPYAYSCKHAVALILIALDHLQEGTPIPNVDLSELVPGYTAPSNLDYDESDRIPYTDVNRVRTALSRIPVEHLIDWATKRISQSPEIPKDLPVGVSPEDIRPIDVVLTSGQIESTRQLIRAATECRFTFNEWDYDGNVYGEIPDYQNIIYEFKALAQNGFVGELLALGEELLTLGIAQLEESSEDEEVQNQLAECMELVMSAVQASDMSASDKVIEYLELRLIDDWYLIPETPDPRENNQLRESDWKLVAQHFIDRMESTPIQLSEGSDSFDYSRGRILDLAVHALRKASALDQAVQLMESEIANCNKYVELVDLLIEMEDLERAKRWIVQGVSTTKAPYHHWVNVLSEKMREIAVKESDWQLAAAIAARFFVEHPDVSSYQAVKDSCPNTSSWLRIRYFLMGYLESGSLDPMDPRWPLPRTVLCISESTQSKYHPQYRILIDIALEEGRLNEAVSWYQQAPYQQVDHLKVAEGVKDSHPEIAIEIWREKIEDLIDTVNVKAYLQAMPILRTFKRYTVDSGRIDEYEQFVAYLQETHKKKPRLMSEIELVESGSKRIVDL